MKALKSILLICFVGTNLTLTAQNGGKKINELFIRYMVAKLDIRPAQLETFTPLVNKYILERKMIVKKFDDPLIRERAVVNLKIQYRKNLSKSIGLDKANRFFVYEQYFRRKVREELKKRRNEKIDSD